MRSDEEIHAALADEFSSYLGSIAKEIVAPVRETVAVQKDAISALIKMWPRPPAKDVPPATSIE